MKPDEAEVQGCDGDLPGVHGEEGSASVAFSEREWESFAPAGHLKCAVITPVGPGHEALVQNALASVQTAFRANPGPFTDVVHLDLPDLAGEHGRSQRRNDGIDYALANGIDWIFFLDADDWMAQGAFASVAPYIREYDAIFGQIAESRVDAPDQVKIRANQLGPTSAIADVLRCDPFLSLQMGHFVRTSAAAAIRFDSKMDTGEDFKYYLNLWNQYRCAKIDQVLFINCRGAHSVGPRSADGGTWRITVTRILKEFQSRCDLNF